MKHLNDYQFLGFEISTYKNGEKFEVDVKLDDDIGEVINSWAWFLSENAATLHALKWILKQHKTGKRNG